MCLWRLVSCSFVAAGPRWRPSPPSGCLPSSPSPAAGEGLPRRPPRPRGPPHRPRRPAGAESAPPAARSAWGAATPRARRGHRACRTPSSSPSTSSSREQPQIFDKTQEAGIGTGQYLVLDKEAYLNGLVANLSAAGFCAQRDPDDFNYERIQAKNENGFSETFDVMSGAGFARTNGIYKETCTPASFPVDRGDLPPAGSGCGAPYPPEINRMNCKLHLIGTDAYTLDSTALVDGLEYCNSVGFIGRTNCPVRKEDSPERRPCEEWRVGHARGHRPGRPDLDRQREVLHRQGERLRQPPREPVRASRLHVGHLPGVRADREVLRGHRRPVSPGPPSRRRGGGLDHATAPVYSRSSGRALNSAVECHLHTVEVEGSNPSAPTRTSEPPRRKDASPTRR